MTSLNQAHDRGAPWWTVAWLTGRVNVQNGHLDEAIANFEKILDPKNQPHQRKFDFTKDYVVINDLAGALFRRAQQKLDAPAERDALLRAPCKSTRRRWRSTRKTWTRTSAWGRPSRCWGNRGLRTLRPMDRRPKTQRGCSASPSASPVVAEPQAQRLRVAGLLSQGVKRFGEQSLGTRSAEAADARPPDSPLPRELRSEGGRGYHQRGGAGARRALPADARRLSAGRKRHQPDDPALPREAPRRQPRG